MNSKRMKGFVFLFIIISLVGLISAASCSVTTSCASGNKLMALSGSTDAHGGTVADSPSYTYFVCCDFLGSSTCTGTNTVLHLYDETNAHAEVPSGSAYDVDICYDGLSCVSGSSCTGEYTIPILSLSDTTNAHIGPFSTYSTKICCKRSSLTWRDPNNNIISEFTTTLNQDKYVLMVLEEDGIGEGDSANFSVYENKLFGDDLIFYEVREALMDEKITAVFSIDDSGLDADDHILYFKTVLAGVTSQSPDLELTIENPDLEFCETTPIVTCESYTNEDDCNDNVCPIGYSSDSCGEQTGECPLVDGCYYQINCGCEWNEDDEVCNEFESESLNPECVGSGCPSSLGQCTVVQMLQPGDTCDEDNFLSYLLNSVWDWEDNSYLTQINGYVTLGTDGKYHYSSTSYATCETTSSREIPCPTSLALPFFGALELTATLIVIVLVYYFIFMFRKKTEKKSKRKVKSRKKK
jgi:hypothetical protein